jgi:hypothetical protein
VLVDVLRTEVAAGVRCVLVVPEVRTRVVVVLVRCVLLSGLVVAADEREVVVCCDAEVREVLVCCDAEVREVLVCCDAEVREALVCCCAEDVVRAAALLLLPLLLLFELLRVLAELLRAPAELLRVLVVVRVAPDCSTAWRS